MRVTCLLLIAVSLTWAVFSGPEQVLVDRQKLKTGTIINAPTWTVPSSDQGSASRRPDSFVVFVSTDSLWPCASHLTTKVYVRQGELRNGSPVWPASWTWQLVSTSGTGTNVIQLGSPYNLATVWAVKCSLSSAGDSAQVSVAVKCLTYEAGGSGGGSVLVQVLDTTLRNRAFMHDSAGKDSLFALYLRSVYGDSAFFSYIGGHSPIRFLNRVTDSIGALVADTAWVLAHAGLAQDTIWTNGPDTLWQHANGNLDWHVGGIAVMHRDTSVNSWKNVGSTSSIRFSCKITQFGNNDSASGSSATVSGGQNNNASGNTSTVSGGITNSATGDGAVVGGGSLNLASGQFSTIGGGSRDTASGDKSTIGGGLSNKASGNYSTVGGGEFNTASGQDATIGGGGLYNAAIGWYSVICGGEGDTALGCFSGVLGGVNNHADDSFSYAWGRGAHARKDTTNFADSCTNAAVITTDYFKARQGFVGNGGGLTGLPKSDSSKESDSLGHHAPSYYQVVGVKGDSSKEADSLGHHAPAYYQVVGVKGDSIKEADSLGHHASSYYGTATDVTKARDTANAGLAKAVIAKDTANTALANAATANAHLHDSTQVLSGDITVDSFVPLRLHGGRSNTKSRLVRFTQSVAGLGAIAGSIKLGTLPDSVLMRSCFLMIDSVSSDNSAFFKCTLAVGYTATLSGPPVTNDVRYVAATSAVAVVTTLNPADNAALDGVALKGWLLTCAAAGNNIVYLNYYAHNTNAAAKVFAFRAWVSAEVQAR